MKVLLISSNSSSAGGGEQYLVYLAKGLAALRIETTVLLSNKVYMNSWENHFRAENISVIREDLIGLRDRPLRFLQSAKDKRQISLIAAICEQVKPDVIHVNQQYDADGLDYVMGALAYGKAPVASTIHMPMVLTRHLRNETSIRTWIIRGLSLDRVKMSFLRNWYKKYNYSKIMVANTMKNEFVSVYGSDKDLHVVASGVDVARIPYGSESKRENVIGFVGRFDYQKDPFLLIGAWLSAREKGLNCKLLLIGDGVLRKEIESLLLKKAPRGSWEITGWVENPYEQMKRLGLLVLTSHFEGFPLAAIEASCMGKLCLCTNFSVAQELKEKIPYLTVLDSRNPDVLGEAIVEVFKKQIPAKEDVEKVRDYFSCQRMAQDTLNLYNSLLKNA